MSAPQSARRSAAVVVVVQSLLWLWLIGLSVFVALGYQTMNDQADQERLDSRLNAWMRRPRAWPRPSRPSSGVRPPQRRRTSKTPVKSWKHALPRDAVLARLGGDEFAACITGDRVQGFLDAIERHTPEVSVGVATRSSSDARVTELYAEADAALYRSRGRPLRDERR